MKITITVLAAFVALAWLPYFNRTETANISADQLYYGQRKFSVNLLHALQKDCPNGSLFVSPHSIYRTLLLLYFLSNGDFEKSLKETLQLNWSNSKADVWRAFELEKIGRINHDQSIEFNSVEKAYFSCDVELKDNVKKMFEDIIEVLNFKSNPERARSQINIFIEDSTKNIIKECLPSGSIKKDTRAVLINAAYFKGNWVSEFKKQATYRKIFYKDNHMPVYVEMMSQQGVFNYGVIKQLNTNFLEMPYQGLNTSISMYIFSPENSSDWNPQRKVLFEYRKEEKAPEINIDQFIEKLTPEILDEVFEHSIGNKIHVEIPKISFHDRLLPSLIPTLAHMGVGKWFSAEFSEAELLELDVFHKANIEVEESGTVAAAATAITVNAVSSSSLTFYCNRPFMFLIHDKRSKEILFAGVYRGPEQ